MPASASPRGGGGTPGAGRAAAFPSRGAAAFPRRGAAAHPRRGVALPSRGAAWALLLALLLKAAPLASAELEPAFRLATGGRPLAPPLLDQSLSPPAVWLLSEDRYLYLLDEGGGLLLKRGFSERILPYLGLDAFGRALILLEPASGRGGPELLALTRSGGEAFRVRLGELEGAALLPPALGADGRLFLGAGSRILCLSQSGLRLWSRELPAPLALAPGRDGAGRLLLGLGDGSLLLLSPYGEELWRQRLGSPALALSAFLAGGLRGGGSGPRAAAALADGRLLLLGEGGEPLLELRPERGGGSAATASAAAAAASSGAAAIAARTLALASDGKLLYGLGAEGVAFALDAEGRLLWRRETGLAAGGPGGSGRGGAGAWALGLAVFRERLVAAGRGRALSLSLEGEVFREAELRNAASAALVSPGGLLFSAGEDWVLAAYRFERPLGPSPAPRPEPYGREDGAWEEALAGNPALREAGAQLALLRDIEKSLESGRIEGEEARIAGLLASIALGEGLLSYPQAERRFRGNPLPRARAARLLGRLGSPEGIEPLLGVLLGDPEVAVKAAALGALGAIAVDPEGEAGRAFLELAGRGRLDEQLGFGLAEAIEAQALRSGSPPSAQALRALLALSAAPYGARLRSRAAAALGRIAGSAGP